ATGPTGPQGPAGTVSADTDRFDFANIGQNFTVYSEPRDLPRGPAPITVAVEFIRFDAGQGTVTGDFPPANEPLQRFPNPILTVYYVDDARRFRIGVTNVASLPINELVVRWWLLGV
ncbi:MAG: hypothetical protein WA040_24885, partial [Anaerolineae bacterium]